MRRLLHAQGLRYRVDYRAIPGSRLRVDIAFTRAKVAVFIDGCFWHGCPEHATYPKTNESYWLPKLARNVERDRQSDTALAESGWAVLRFWEHESAHDVIERVREALATR